MKKAVLILVILSFIISNGCSEPVLQTCPDGSQAKSISLCPNEDPQLVAERFGRFWEQKDWNSMYDLFIPELQEMKTKKDFVEFADYTNKDTTIVIRLDKISKDNENISYAYYSGSLGAIELKIPALRMVLIDKRWKFDAFAEYFTKDLNQTKYEDFIKPIIIGYNDAINTILNGFDLDNIYIVQEGCNNFNQFNKLFNDNVANFIPIISTTEYDIISETIKNIFEYCKSPNKGYDIYLVREAKTTIAPLLDKYNPEK